MKRGISLIAVLMFMLAATTASVVVFKMIGSENFSSGARLKMSESEAAANNGLDAVQAWLENKAPDVGVMLSDYVNNKRTVFKIGNDILGTVGGDRNQNYNVYLVGADTTKRPFKLKFLSEGIARDNSKNNQIAIFGVDGLYRMALPYVPPAAPFHQAFFGKSLKFIDGTEFSDAIINGDYSGNAPTVTGTLVVSGNMALEGGTSYGCGDGDLYVAGKLTTTGNKIDICGNAYFGEIETGGGVTGTFKKDLYVKNNMNIGYNYTIGGNLAIETGNLTTGGTAALTIEGDLSFLSNTGRIYHENGRVTWVKGTTWLPSGTAPNSADLILNEDNNRKLFVGTNWCENGDGQGTTGDAAGYYQFDPTADVNGRIRSKNDLYCYGLDCTKSCTLPEIDESGVNVANKLQELEERLNAERVKVEDPIRALNPASWVDEAKKFPARCATALAAEPAVKRIPGTTLLADRVTIGSNEFSEQDFVYALNKCYELLSNSDGLHNGFLPIIINNNEDRKPQGPLNGNFFFIYVGTNAIGVPPTTTSGKVMMYFPNAEHGGTDAKVDGLLTKVPSCKNTEIARLGLDACPSIYNYFIFSERDMKGINNFSGITGSVFMAEGKVMDQLQGGTSIDFNEELYNALMAAGILGLTEAGMAAENISGSPQSTKPDTRFTPLSPRLRVTVESRYQSTENINATNDSLRGAVMVMPRLVYLPTDANFESSPGNAIDNYFSVLYLNGLKDGITITDRETNPNWRAKRGTTSCQDVELTGTSLSWSNASPPDQGDYRCIFTLQGTTVRDTFFVRVVKELGSSTVQFDDDSKEIPLKEVETDKACVDAYINFSYNKAPDACNGIIVVPTEELPAGWTIETEAMDTDLRTPNWGVINLNREKSSYKFEVCVKESDLPEQNFVEFQISNPGAGCQDGRKPNRLEVKFSGGTSTLINRERDGSKNNIPDCDLYQLIAPVKYEGAKPSCGAFQINAGTDCSLPTCEKGNYGWKCLSEENAEYSANIRLDTNTTIPAHCEYIAEASKQITTGTNAVFKADIKRRAYTLNFNNPDGLNITLTPNGTDNCLNMESAEECGTGTNILPPVSCIGTGCGAVTIYGGVPYNVVLSQDALAGVIGNVSISGIGPRAATTGVLEVSGYDDVSNSRTLLVRKSVPPGVNCKVKPGATAQEGYNFTYLNDFEERIMEVPADTMDNFGRCIKQEVKYYTGNDFSMDVLNPNFEFAYGETIEIWAEITCSADSELDNKVIRSTSSCGSFGVTQSEQPEISCNFEKPEYSKDQIAELNIRVKNGSAKTCNDVITVSGIKNTTSVPQPSEGTCGSGVPSLTTTCKRFYELDGEDEGTLTATVQTNCTDNGGVNPVTINNTCNVTISDLRPCEYEPSFCEGTAIADVGLDMPPAYEHRPVNSCYFVSNIYGVFNAGDYKINGVPCNGYSGNIKTDEECGALETNRKDGGYYIWVGSIFTYNVTQATEIPEQCLRPVQSGPACNWGPKTIFDGESANLPVTKQSNGSYTINNNSVTCTGGGTPTVTNVRPYEIETTWLNPESQISASNVPYDIEVYVTGCGGGGSWVECGDLTVKPKPILSCGNIGGSSTNPTEPTVTCTDGTISELTWLYDYSGSGSLSGTSTTWNGIFQREGTYNNIKAQAKCGAYSVLLTGNCNGNQPITPSCGNGFLGDMCGGGSSSSSGGGGCITYVGGVGHCGNCYNSGLTGMTNGKCYKLNPGRDCNTLYTNNGDASDIWWWVETPCI